MLRLRCTASLIKRQSLTTFQRSLSSSVASTSNKDRHVLTSTIIGRTENGDYPWNVIAILAPHEMLRREIARGAEALDNFDLLLRPWQSYCFSEWFTQFLVPAMREHHEVEDKVSWVHLKAVGVKIPVEQQNHHKELDNLMQDVTSITQELQRLIDDKDLHVDAVRDGTEDLRDAYGRMIRFAFHHFKEEEAYWPTVITRVSESTFNEWRQDVGQYTMKHFPGTYGASICASLHCMGVQIEGSSHILEPEKDKGWAGQVLRDRVVEAMLPEVKREVLPEHNRKYMAFRILIDACTKNDTDLPTLEGRIKAVMGIRE